jgi:phospholipid/cholesterol/gamma-HCH transport system substrate-binding protein
LNTATGRARIVVAIALGAALLWALIGLLGGGDRYSVTATFQNASQIVGGEWVTVGGAPAGKVTGIRLADDGRARISFEVDDEFAPLRRGTRATVRSSSLSGVANRVIQLTLPADGEAGEEIADGGELTEAETVSEVDIDALFNTLDDETIANLKKTIRGFEQSYTGVTEEANRGYRYANPLLSASRRVTAELLHDRAAFRNLVVDAAQLSGTLEGRSTDLTELIGNANTAMAAIARQSSALERSVAVLPPFITRFNTTAVNLRAALDDLDPLVEAGRPAAEQLRPFLAALRRVASRAVPASTDLDRALTGPGADDDLVELVGRLPALADLAVGDGEIGGGDLDCGGLGSDDDDFGDGALDETACSLRNSLKQVEFLRPYAPELVGWFNDFGYSGVIDANGGIGRIAALFNTYSPATVPLPDPLRQVDTITEQFGALTTGYNSRCPGALERDPGDGSTPFTDGGKLACDPTQVPVGP